MYHFTFTNQDFKQENFSSFILNTYQTNAGVFSTLGSFFSNEIDYSQNNNPYKFFPTLDLHIKRLLKNANELNLINESSYLLKPKYVIESLNKLFSLEQIKIFLLANNSEKNYVKLRLIVRNNNLEVTLESCVKEKEQVRLCTYNGPIREKAEIKTTNIEACLNSLKYAHLNNCDESIFTKDGFVLETTWSNIFWINGQTLYTNENSILKGITREIIINNLGCKFSKISSKELLEEKLIVFVTKSTSGPTIVSEIDSITKITDSNVFKKLKSTYDDYLMKLSKNGY